MGITKTGNFTISSLIRNKDMYDSKYANGDISYSGTMTKTRHNEYTNFRIEIEKPTANLWMNWTQPAFSGFVAGDTYLYRCWIRCNECGENVSLELRGARLNNDYKGCNRKTVCSLSLADKKWHEYYVIQNVPATFIYNNNTETCAPRFEMYTSNLYSASSSTIILDFDIMNVEVVTSESYVPISSMYEGIISPPAMGKNFVCSSEFIEY